MDPKRAPSVILLPTEPSGVEMVAKFFRALGDPARLRLLECCGLPVLIASGALGALGAILVNPWVIAAALALVAARLRRRARRADGCCPPEPSARVECRPSGHSALDPHPGVSPYRRDRPATRNGGRS